MLRLLPLILLLGCAAKAVPPESVPEPATFQLDRSALPELTLRVLVVAETAGSERVIVQGGGGDRWTLPVYVYVIEHPTEGVVLIDAGFPKRTGQDAASYPGKRMANTLSLSMEPGSSAVERLGDAGLDPGDVKHIILTHMHPDHVGGIEDFPAAQVWVGPGEWEDAQEPGLLGKPDVSPFIDHATVHHLDFGGSAPIGPFDGSKDLFGDGSLVVAPSPGHTAGSISVFANLRSATYLFTGDCAWVERHWADPAPKSGLVRGLLEHDWRLNWSYQWRIHAFAEAHDDVVVVAGHEPSTRDKLAKWPEPIR